MNFKSFHSQKKVIEEISQKYIDKLPSYNKLKNLITKKIAPFNDIFGDNIRLYEPLNQKSELDKNITTVLDNEYVLDFDNWVGYKIQDTTKKNPIRLGKILQKKKTDLIKKKKELEISLNKEENNNSEDSVSVYNVEAVLKIKNDITKIDDFLKKIDELLKISDLQKSYKGSKKSEYYVIYSRLPEDVVRMSDFSWNSCHSEGGSYFYCALADASLNAGIAYLVEKRALDSLIEQNGEDILQTEYLFEDSDRGTGKIEAIGRIRIRRLIDDKGNELAVPSLRVYKNTRFSGFEEDFKNQLISWAKKQDVSNIDWDNTLTLRGGTYEDYSYDMSKMVKLIWNKDISYTYDVEDEEDFRQELDQENDDNEEQWWDARRDEVENDLDSKVYRAVFGDDYDTFSSVEYDVHQGSVELTFNISKKLLEKYIPKNITEDSLKIYLEFDGSYSHRYQYLIKYELDLDSYELKITSNNRIDFYSYGDYNGDYNEGHFDENSLYRDLKNYISELFEMFTDESPSTNFLSNSFLINKSVIKNFFKVDVSNDERLNLDSEEVETFYNNYKHEKGFLENLELINIRIPKINYEVYTSYYGTRELSFVDKPKVQKQLIALKNELHDSILNAFYEKYQNLTYINFVNIYLLLEKPKVNTQNQTQVFIASESNKLIGITSKDQPFSSFFVAIALEEGDFTDIIDHGQLYEFTKALDWLTEEVGDEIHNIKDIGHLIDYFNNLAKSGKNEYQNLKNQGQLELDLSSINSNMTNFDKFIKEFLEEGLGSMGSGGISNRGGASTQVNSTSAPAGTGGPSVTGGVKMKYAGKGQSPINPTSITNQNPIDYSSIFNSDDPNTIELFKSDPKNLEGFRGFLSDPKNRDTFKKSFKDPNKYSSALELLLQ